MFRWYTRWRLRRQTRTRTPGKIGNRSGFGRLLATILAIPRGLLRGLAAPYQMLLDASNRGKGRVRDLLLGIPAFLAAVSVVGVTLYAHSGRSQAELRNWGGLWRAMAADDLPKAKLIVQRALNGGVVDRNEASFALARIYVLSGANQRASAVLSTLAPEDSAGYPPAHRMQAIIASDRFRAKGDPADIVRLQWHLEHADEETSADMYRARGLYHAAKGETDKAVEILLMAVESRPDVYFEIAELLVRIGRNQEAAQMVTRAETVYRARFDINQDNDETRLRLATALFALGKLPDAERLVKERLARGDDPKFKNLLSMIFVRFFDHQLAEGQPFEDCFPALQKAIEADAENQEALKRLLAIAKRETALINDIKDVLRKSIASGGASAMSHYVLGVIEWMEENKESAKFHLQQALELSPQWSVVANNLAYLEAVSEDGNLEYADELASIAVYSDPENPEFWDTRGTVRERRGDFNGAVADYQRALDLADDAAQFRQKLAVVYRKLGKPELAAAFEAD